MVGRCTVGGKLLLGVFDHESGQVEAEQGLEAHGDALDCAGGVDAEDDLEVEEDLVEVGADLVDAEAGLEELGEELER